MCWYCLLNWQDSIRWDKSCSIGLIVDVGILAVHLGGQCVLVLSVKLAR